MDLDPDPMDLIDLDLDLDPIHPSLTLCIPVSWLIVGVQARSFGRWVTGVQTRQLSDSGSSTVRASGSNSS